jgi:hypothetical protein
VCAASIADSDGADYILHESEGRFPRLHTILVDQGYKGWLVEFAKHWFHIIVDAASPGQICLSEQVESRDTGDRRRLLHTCDLL